MSDKWYISGPLTIGTSEPTGQLTLEGMQPGHGRLTFFSNSADVEFDGGSDGIFLFSNTSPNGKTAFVGGNIGIGTTEPLANLSVSGANSTTQIETSTVLHLLRPGVPTIKNSNSIGLSVGAFEEGITGRTRLDIKLSGAPQASNQWGSIPDVTVMTLQADGNVGIGTTDPKARLSIVGLDANQIDGTAQSSAFRISAGTLGAGAGSELSLASIGFHSGNNTSLGVRAHRFTNGSDWTTTAIGLGIDVDNTIRVNDASLWLHPAGRVGISISTPQAKLHVNGDTLITGNTTVGAGGNAVLKVRHINGKGYTTPDPDGADALYLNYDNSKPVHIGGGATSDLHVSGNIAIGGKHAFRGYDSWLRLNEGMAFSSGVHTPGLFYPGSLMVGGGTTFDKVQGGTTPVGHNSGSLKKNVQIEFPSEFTAIPHVIVTVRGVDDLSHDDTFAASTNGITTAGARVNIYRVNGGGWAQELELDWFAWTQA